MTKIKAVSITFLTALLAACPSVEGGPGGKGTISGRAVDASSKPIAGALIWVKPAVTTGLVRTTTDAQGNYRVEGLPNVPYEVYAWAQPTYNGKRHCLRLGHDNPNDYNAVVPTQGVVRNFRWKLEGVIADRGNDTFFGGEVRLFTVWRGDNDFSGNFKVEVKFTPTGPLVDGSTGKTVARIVNWAESPFARDVPVGAYRVTATLIDAGGQRSALEIGMSDTSLGAQAAFEFKPSSSSCGGDFGNGTERAFMYIARP